MSNGKFLRISKRLLVPYFTFSLLNFLAASVMAVLRKENCGYLLPKLIQIITTGNGPIWFLFALWLVELVVLVSRLQKRAVFIRMMVVITGIYLPFGVGNENDAVMTLLCRVLIGTAFYLIGYDLCRFCVLNGEKSVAIAVGVLLIGGVSITALGCDYSLFTGRYTSVAGSSVSMICGSVGLLLLFRGIPLQFELLSAIGRHSMTMLIVHQYIIRVGTFVLFSSGLFQWGNIPMFGHIFVALAYCAVTAAVSFMISMPMERLFPLYFGVNLPQKYNCNY